MPTEDFFPAGSTGAASDRIALVKAVCAVCPVAGECLEYALGTGRPTGCGAACPRTSGAPSDDAGSGASADDERSGVTAALRTRVEITLSFGRCSPLWPGFVTHT
ncbi:MAG: WhiB family transcriptional regulator [Egibacteraceae bacterium]